MDDMSPHFFVKLHLCLSEFLNVSEALTKTVLGVYSNI